MDNNERKMLVGAQQAELNAVLMYKEFAKITKDEELKKIFLAAAADEGKHANILSKHTGEKLTPKKAQAKVLGCAFRILPKKVIFNLIAQGEYSGGDSYKPHIGKYPDFEEMMNDEYRHGDTFSKLANKK